MIKEIILQNIGPFEDLVVKAGALTVISGTNGEGKSLLINVILAVFQGGFHPEMVRKGCKKGSITIILSNGTTIEQIITLDKSRPPKITDASGEEKKSPATFLKELASGFSLDPIAFIKCGEGQKEAGLKKRLEFLRQIFGSNYAATELVEAVGEANVYLDKPGGTDPLIYDLDGDQFDALFEKLYDKRTRANSDVDNFQKTVTTLTRNLPEEPDGTDWKSEVNRLRTEKTALDEEKLSEITKIEVEQHDLLTSIALSLHQDIEALRKKFEEICEEARGEAAKKSEEVRAKATATRQELDAAADPVIQAKVAELTSAEDRLKNVVKIQTTKEDIEAIRNQAREAGVRALRLDESVKRLQELKKSKLEALPGGMELREGRLFVDGLDFDTQINTARQYEISFQLCARALGELPLMVCDKGEALEVTTTRKEFEAAALASGVQVIYTAVEPGPLKIIAKN